ncbi:MAG: hypothetical protein DSZ23_00245 [Thermodesulfatator sp.]|nr:MAG: hypothetical protein DSZ23_00245 [Thermodesulfatator sp.]
MKNLEHNLKPAGSIRTQMLLAALMWSAVGVFLFLRGVWNIALLDDTLKYLWIAGALVIGLVKAKIVLEKTARKITKRIYNRPEKSCVFGFLSTKSWLLIAIMIIMGKLLRATPLPRALVWSVYVAIGAALFASSRIIWKSWQELKAA